MNNKIKVILGVLGTTALITMTGITIGVIVNNADKFEEIAKKATKIADNAIEKWCDKLDKRLERVLEAEELEKEEVLE